MAAKSPEQVRLEQEAAVRAEPEVAEYSTYRAILPIVYDGALVHVPGHAVPVSNVERHGWFEQGLVEKIKGDEKSAAEDRARVVQATSAPAAE